MGYFMTHRSPLIRLLLLPEDDVVVKAARSQDVSKFGMRPGNLKYWSLVSYQICVEGLDETCGNPGP